MTDGSVTPCTEHDSSLNIQGNSRRSRKHWKRVDTYHKKCAAHLDSILPCTWEGQVRKPLTSEVKPDKDVPDSELNTFSTALVHMNNVCIVM